jgi:hypothetical protein
MRGASQFIEKNFKSINTTFDLCMQTIIYGYTQLSKQKKYSRKNILKETTRIREKATRVIELEDYLRNDLLTNFIQPNQHKFNLQNYLFIPGVDEISKNVRTGILDIKVCSPTFTGAVYYIFECKRLNTSIIKGYIYDGITRFLKGKYYPDSHTPLAGMISFLEHNDIKQLIKIDDYFNVLNTALNKETKSLKILANLKNHSLDCKTYKFVREYKYIFSSVHKRTKSKMPITLYHIALDYNDLISD